METESQCLQITLNRKVAVNRAQRLFKGRLIFTYKYSLSPPATHFVSVKKEKAVKIFSCAGDAGACEFG